MFEKAATTISRLTSHPFFQRLSRLGNGVTLIHSLAEMRVRADGQLDRLSGLMYLLHQTRDYLASDPVDKVFALLGLVPSIGLFPDHTMTPEEVYGNLVRLAIGATGQLAILFLIVSRRGWLFLRGCLTSR